MPSRRCYQTSSEWRTRSATACHSLPFMRPIFGDSVLGICFLAPSRAFADALVSSFYETSTTTMQEGVAVATVYHLPAGDTNLVDGVTSAEASMRALRENGQGKPQVLMVQCRASFPSANPSSRAEFFVTIAAPATASARTSAATTPAAGHRLNQGANMSDFDQPRMSSLAYRRRSDLAVDSPSHFPASCTTSAGGRCT